LFKKPVIVAEAINNKGYWLRFGGAGDLALRFAVGKEKRRNDGGGGQTFLVRAWLRCRRWRCLYASISRSAAFSKWSLLAASAALIADSSFSLLSFSS
jgi:hypothetical protein